MIVGDIFLNSEPHSFARMNLLNRLTDGVESTYRI